MFEIQLPKNHFHLKLLCLSSLAPFVWLWKMKNKINLTLPFLGTNFFLWFWAKQINFSLPFHFSYSDNLSLACHLFLIFTWFLLSLFSLHFHLHILFVLFFRCSARCGNYWQHNKMRREKYFFLSLNFLWFSDNVIEFLFDMTWKIYYTYFFAQYCSF